MVVAPGSWDMTVWDDIVRMKTLNTSQSQRRQNLHVCPLQIDIVQRLIERYSNEGELVADPFAGLFTVPYEAVKMNRKGKGVELNPDYFRDGVGYLESADAEKDAPTLFDLLEFGGWNLLQILPSKRPVAAGTPKRMSVNLPLGAGVFLFGLRTGQDPHLRHKEKPVRLWLQLSAVLSESSFFSK